MSVALRRSRHDQPETAETGPRVFPRGRRCDTAGCSTVLSIYNPGESCNACLAEQAQRTLEAERRASRAMLAQADERLTVEARVLVVLREAAPGSLSRYELAGLIDASPATTGHALAALAGRGDIDVERRGRESFYRVPLAERAWRELMEQAA